MADRAVCSRVDAAVGKHNGVVAAGIAAIVFLGLVDAYAGSRLKPVLSVGLSERYDSNVMLQNEGAQAGQDSFVTSVLPELGARIAGEGPTSYSASLLYAPDFTFFHDLSRESYLRHIGLLDFGMTHRGFRAKAHVETQYTDGTTDPPVWGTSSNGDQVPAQGACEVRGRRRQMLFISRFACRQQLEETFLRAVCNAGVWDFMTQDTFIQGELVQNYYDRSDINGGFDFGLSIHPMVEPFVGYRVGDQYQEFRAVPSYDPAADSFSYANTYHRFLVGLSAEPADWMSLKGEVGPSFHYFDAATIAPGASTETAFLYFKASATLNLSTNTLLELLSGQYLLPSSAGNGVYQNLSASGKLIHDFSSRCRGSLSVEWSDYDFHASFTRHDQRFAPGLQFAYAFSKHLTASARYAYERGVNLLDDPGTSKRDYDRHIVGVQLDVVY